MYIKSLKAANLLAPLLTLILNTTLNHTPKSNKSARVLVSDILTSKISTGLITTDFTDFRLDSLKFSIQDVPQSGPATISLPAPPVLPASVAGSKDSALQPQSAVMLCPDSTNFGTAVQNLDNCLMITANSGKTEIYDYNVAPKQHELLDNYNQNIFTDSKVELVIDFSGNDLIVKVKTAGRRRRRSENDPILSVKGYRQYTEGGDIEKTGKAIVIDTETVNNLPFEEIEKVITKVEDVIEVIVEEEEGSGSGDGSD